ncbi:hypothetical protein [Nakamurella sp.]|uniref:hypothetical protein n=1 Tax=Nakamurella sp. TaxID=1869182 RepID=UPI003784D32D
MTVINLAAVTLPTTDGATLSFAESGRRTILLLANQKSGPAARTVAARILEDPALAGIPLVQVAHLVGVPRLVRRLAEREIRNGLAGQRKQLQARLAAAGLPDDSASRLRLGLDWEGRVTTPLGYSAADEAPALGIVDERGCAAVVGSPEAMGRLRELATRPAELPN